MATTIIDRLGTTFTSSLGAVTGVFPSAHIAIKMPCDVATTGNITLNSTQTIDGVSLSTGARVLVRAQSTTSENGIYIVESSGWTRAPDFDSGAEITQGTRVFVNQGTAYANTMWRLGSSGSLTIDTSALTFINESSATGADIISGTTISGAHITGSTVTGGVISNTTISGADITTSTWTGGTITNPTISGADISGSTITGGLMDGTVIGSSTPAAGTFTQLIASSFSGAQISGSTISGGNISGSTIDSALITNSTISGGTASGLDISGSTITGGLIDNAVIGSSTPAAGTFTQLTASTATITGALKVSSGKAINLGSSVAITHSSASGEILTFSGAGSGYRFSTGLYPTNQGVGSLGNASLAWGNLFLSSGAVINFSSGDITITHSNNLLAFAGASSGYTFDAGVSFTGGTITGATISGGNVTGSTIASAQINNSTLSGGVISGVDISGSTISGGTASGLDISGSTISGGLMDGTVIGSSTPAAGTFTQLIASSFSGAQITGSTISGGNITGSTISSALITGSTISGGLMDGTIIGSSTPAAGTFTHLAASTIERMPITIVKSTDETVNNSTVLQNDDELAFSIGTTENVVAEYTLFVDGASTAHDMKMGLTGPTGIAGRTGIIALSGSVNSALDNNVTMQSVGLGSNMTVGVDGAQLHVIRLFASMTNSTNTGTINLRWAQNAAVVGDLTVKKFSYVTVKRL